MPRNVKDINIEVGARIKALRKEHKMTREALAQLAGYSANFIQEVELGRSGLSSESIRAFAMALDVSTDAILFGKAEGDFSFVVEKLRAVPADKLPHVIRIINEAVECTK